MMFGGLGALQVWQVRRSRADDNSLHPVGLAYRITVGSMSLTSEAMLA